MSQIIIVITIMELNRKNIIIIIGFVLFFVTDLVIYVCADCN
jgi:hypothetical protein